MSPDVKSPALPTRAGADSKSISFRLNGRDLDLQVGPNETLLHTLRERCGIISTKDGCAPEAQCGCCAVLIDGKARFSCAMKTSKAAGREVTTLEGLTDTEREQVSACFTSCGGVQCGFCIPGMAIRGVAILNANPEPTRDEIKHQMRTHLCRCTGYEQIVDSIELLGRVRQGAPIPEADTSGGVGTSMDRYRSNEFVLGDFKYVDDIRIDGQLYAAMRFSDHPRALVKGIDAAPALAAPGVARVLTAEDVPGDRYVGLIVKDWPILVAIGEETRCEGDILAIVVAETQAQAREAAALVEIDYEVRKPITDPADGLAPDAHKIHPGGNLLSKSAIKRGDVEAAFAASAYIEQDTYQAQRIEHAFLEPEACIAIPGEENGEATLKILTQGQGVFDDRRQCASVLGWDIARIEVELVSNGGAFGGKEDMSIQAQTSLAATLLGRPVKCTLTRPESIRLHPKRHPVRMEVKVGCDKDGHLTALHARILGDKGAYASVGAKVIERAAGHATGPYRFPNVDIEALAVYTNNPPCGAMRGFGANQSSFAIESLLNRLARRVGINAWEMRYRNVLVQGDRFCTGQKLTKPFGLMKTLEAVKEQFLAAKFAGIACGIKNVGIGNGMPDNGKAAITIDSADKATIRSGFTEMGQGLFTVLIQTACEETGLAPATFDATTDTSLDLDCGQTTASRGTVLGCLAVQDAARKLKADLDAGKSLGDLVGTIYHGEVSFTYTSKLGGDDKDPKTHISYGFATQVAILDDDGRVAKFIAAHDVGKVMNPTLLTGQMMGSIHMGLGYALTEELPVDDESRLVNKNLKSLGILRAPHMPELEIIFIEEPDPECPYGARGVGEIGLVPTAPAVAGALEAFDGVHRTELPMKDSEAARSILDLRWKPSSKRNGAG